MHTLRKLLNTQVPFCIIAGDDILGPVHMLVTYRDIPHYTNEFVDSLKVDQIHVGAGGFRYNIHILTERETREMRHLVSRGMIRYSGERRAQACDESDCSVYYPAFGVSIPGKEVIK